MKAPPPGRELCPGVWLERERGFPSMVIVEKARLAGVTERELRLALIDCGLPLSSVDAICRRLAPLLYERPTIRVKFV